MGLPQSGFATALPSYRDLAGSGLALEEEAQEGGEMSAPSYRELRGMSETELVELYDRKRQNVSIGLNFVRQELALRQQERQSRTIVRLTWIIAALTLVVTITTVVNVVN